MNADEKILKLLQGGGAFTAIQLNKLYGRNDCRKVVSRLRKEGHPIEAAKFDDTGRKGYWYDWRKVRGGSTELKKRQNIAFIDDLGEVVRFIDELCHLPEWRCLEGNYGGLRIALSDVWSQRWALNSTTLCLRLVKHVREFVKACEFDLITAYGEVPSEIASAFASLRRNVGSGKDYHPLLLNIIRNEAFGFTRPTNIRSAREDSNKRGLCCGKTIEEANKIMLNNGEHVKITHNNENGYAED